MADTVASQLPKTAGCAPLSEAGSESVTATVGFWLMKTESEKICWLVTW